MDDLTRCLTLCPLLWPDDACEVVHRCDAMASPTTRHVAAVYVDGDETPVAETYGGDAMAALNKLEFLLSHLARTKAAALLRAVGDAPHDGISDAAKLRATSEELALLRAAVASLASGGGVVHSYLSPLGVGYAADADLRTIAPRLDARGVDLVAIVARVMDARLACLDGRDDDACQMLTRIAADLCAREPEGDEPGEGVAEIEIEVGRGTVRVNPSLRSCAVGGPGGATVQFQRGEVVGQALAVMEGQPVRLIVRRDVGHVESSASAVDGGGAR